MPASREGLAALVSRTTNRAVPVWQKAQSIDFTRCCHQTIHKMMLHIKCCFLKRRWCFVIAFTGLIHRRMARLAFHTQSFRNRFHTLFARIQNVVLVRVYRSVQSKITTQQKTKRLTKPLSRLDHPPHRDFPAPTEPAS